MECLRLYAEILRVSLTIVSACIYLKFKKHTQKFRLRSPMRRKFISRVTCAENPLVEFLRPYADTLRVSIRILRTCAHCEVWSFCVRMPETIVTCAENRARNGVPCAENPVVECVRPYANILRVTIRIVRTYAHHEVWSFCVQIPETLVTCAENPVVESHAQKIQ